MSDATDETLRLTEDEQDEVCICPWGAPVDSSDAHSPRCLKHRAAVEHIFRNRFEGTTHSPVAWPDGQWPTPAEWVAWVNSLPAERRLEVAERAIANAQEVERLQVLATQQAADSQGLGHKLRQVAAFADELGSTTDLLGPTINTAIAHQHADRLRTIVGAEHFGHHQGDSSCVCPAGVCRDPWAYLCVGPTPAATEWGVKATDAYGVVEVVSYGPHRQTAEQAVFLVGQVLVKRTYGEESNWAEVER